MTKTKTGLAILARKAEVGKGKTRLAKGIGVQQAYQAYKHLIEVTASVTKASGLFCTVFFDPEIGDTNLWQKEHFNYRLQVQYNNLGDRIAAGLEEVLFPSEASNPELAAGAKADKEAPNGALIMGTDCPTLTPDILIEAGKALETNDAILGPTHDGGFYLLGVKTLDASLFEGVEWSTEKVADQMIAAFERLGYTYQLSPKLTDIDEKEDWEEYQSWRIQQNLAPVVLKDKALS